MLSKSSFENTGVDNKLTVDVMFISGYGNTAIRVSSQKIFIQNKYTLEDIKEFAQTESWKIFWELPIIFTVPFPITKIVYMIPLFSFSSKLMPNCVVFL